MIRTDKEFLAQYTTGWRLWQGMPGIEVTKKGRVFASFYSGGVGEGIGNVALVLVSDDGGKTFSEPVVAAYCEGHRCFDQCIWIDPLDRLWFIWSIMPDDGVYASICDDPDADELVWSEARLIGHEIMLNKPTVLSTSEWLFPMAVWKREMRKAYSLPYDKDAVSGAWAYKTIDNGKTFEKIGVAQVAESVYDEHMFLEREDGSLACFVRTTYGIGVCYSYDGGKNWTEGVNSGYGKSRTRFHIRRLRSGRILMVYHADTDRRNNLAAFLSEDDGKTWPHKLILDERYPVSYPDAKEAEDGYIYIIWDYERGGATLEQAYAAERALYMAKITEDDIIAGRILSKEGKTKHIVSKLGKYLGESENPFKEPERYSDSELAEMILKEHPEDVVGKIFEYYPVDCVNINKAANEKVDILIEQFMRAKENKTEILRELISQIRRISVKSDDFPLIDEVKNIVFQNVEGELSVKTIAQKLGISVNYLNYRFKKNMGTTVLNYRNEIRIAKAKRMLRNTNENMTEIALRCGFGTSSYFSEMFMKSEGVSPSKYRELLKNKS